MRSTLHANAAGDAAHADKLNHVVKACVCDCSVKTAYPQFLLASDPADAAAFDGKESLNGLRCSMTRPYVWIQ